MLPGLWFYSELQLHSPAHVIFEDAVLDSGERVVQLLRHGADLAAVNGVFHAFVSKSADRRDNGGGAGAGQSAAGGTWAQIRQLINSGRYAQAEAMLDAMPQSDHQAEWNFLKGCVLLQKGWYYDAQRFFDIACYMDPANREYQAARDNLKNNAGRFGRGYSSAPSTNMSGCCDACSAMICADCLCECCGGDLISCC